MFAAARRKRPNPAAVLCVLAQACGGLSTTSTSITPRHSNTLVLSIIGTNDVHGHVRSLPLLGGYLRNLRHARRNDGDVLLVDGGDMFQGTLESNLLEGEPIIDAYEVLQYDAVAIGNHEFDYGPRGASSLAESPNDNARGALEHLIDEASYPFLCANLHRQHAQGLGLDEAAHVVIEKAGLQIGIIGVATEETLTTTAPGNVADLHVERIVDAITREAQHLRRLGVNLVVVTAHAGGDCSDTSDPNNLSSCDPTDEVFQVAQALPNGLVDVIVGGHTHKSVAHMVNNIAIIESESLGRAFGRVDVHFDRESHTIVERNIFAPQFLCTDRGFTERPLHECTPSDYEGASVAFDDEVEAAIEPAIAHARGQREQLLATTLSAPITRSHGEESALGNWFTDLMLRAHPEATIALMNGGGLRADLPAGELSYGALYEAFPFDNRFALLHITGAQLRHALLRNAQGSNGFLSVAGIHVSIQCADVTNNRGNPTLRMWLSDSSEIGDEDAVDIVTTDFLANGGDNYFPNLTPQQIPLAHGRNVREVFADLLHAAAGTIDPASLTGTRRVDFRGPRPVCAGQVVPPSASL